MTNVIRYECAGIGVLTPEQRRKRKREAERQRMKDPVYRAAYNKPLREYVNRRRANDPEFLEELLESVKRSQNKK